MRTRWQLIIAGLLCLIAGFPAHAKRVPIEETKPGILVVGDSLSAEYGLQRGSGWVALMAQRIDDKKLNYRVNNASISGDTTSGGLSRLPAALQQHQPDIVIIELGSNDALRGLSLDMTRNNLQRMIDLTQEAGAKVALVPFLLDGMAADRTLFQSDGIHPNEAAQAILEKNVWQGLKPLLSQPLGQ